VLRGGVVVTALSDALTAAQRSALAALEKAYVAGAIEAEAMVAALESVGISDLAGLTKPKASELIDSLNGGSYDPAAWSVPF
jgi:hypothetical protein